MSSYLLRSLFGLCLLLSLAACDVGRSDLDEDPPDGNGGAPPEELEGSCMALIDGERFTADEASASVDPDGTLGFSCEDSPVEILFSLKPENEGPATLSLGVLGNRAQYRVGQDLSVTVELPGGEEAGEVVLTTYTRNRVAGTFRLTVPGFEQGDEPIRVTAGAFDIEMR